MPAKHVWSNKVLRNEKADMENWHTGLFFYTEFKENSKIACRFIPAVSSYSADLFFAV